VKLVDEIIGDALDGERGIADVLRKCLVLAFELKNSKLKNWVKRELNGYYGVEPDEVPDYRKAHLFSKGNFQGPFGGWIPNRPLPMGVLDKKHREVLVPTFFREPIAAYQKEARGKGTPVINWPPDLIAIYQAKFLEGYALAQAWQEVSPGLMPAIVDTVRNRVLRFALEIREELGHVADKPSNVPSEKVEAAVNNYIFGGNNVIGSQVGELKQVGSVTINQGDIGALRATIAALGIGAGDLAKLEAALNKDSGEGQTKIGKTTSSWIETIGKKFGGASWKVGSQIGTAVLQKNCRAISGNRLRLLSGGRRLPGAIYYHIIDQSGKIVFQHHGEGQYEQMGRAIAHLLSANS
jgi:hypothetical protein